MQPIRRLMLAVLALAISLPGTAQESIGSGPPAPSVPATLSRIQGNALTATNAALRDAHVRLRDARSGRIVVSTTTDQAGLFTFDVSRPGSYVAELVGPGQSVLAASQILYLNPGETASTVVKLPFRIPADGGALGHTSAAALVVTAAAAASGVLAAVVAGPDVSPRK